MYTRFIWESIALWPDGDSQRKDETVFGVHALRPPDMFDRQVHSTALLREPHSASNGNGILMRLGPGFQRKGQSGVAAAKTKRPTIGTLHVRGILASESHFESVVRSYATFRNQITVCTRPGPENRLSGQPEFGRRLPSNP